MEYTWYVDIFNNRFQQNNLAGIIVSPTGSGVQYVRVYDNWFNDCIGPAMQLGECDYSLIRSNHIFNNEAQLSGTFAGLGIHTASGFYLAHPDAVYFNVGRIGDDQLRDWAQRQALELKAAERLLAPTLG